MKRVRTSYRANCRAQGCRSKTRAIYVVRSRVVVRLCPQHRSLDVILKPAVAQ